MHTSNFATAAHHPNAISIARRSPRGLRIRSYPALAPSRQMLEDFKRTGDTAQFDRDYAELLGRLDPRQVMRDIGENSILCCRELPFRRCHRRCAAEWLQQALGVTIPELGFDQYPAYDELPRNTDGPGLKPKVLHPPRSQTLPTAAERIPATSERKEPSMRQHRSVGSIYRRNQIWWIKFSVRGIPHAETTRSTNKSVAKELLRQRLAEVQTNSFFGKRECTFQELIDDFLHHAEMHGRKSLRDNVSRVKHHIAPYLPFRGRLASEITSDLIMQYIRTRQKEGAENGTINRELAIISRAFALGKMARKCRETPFIERLKEPNVRKGFLEAGDLRKLLDGAELWFRAMVLCGYTWGWRSSELTGLRVEQVDLLRRCARLDAFTTKNDQARKGFMTDELAVLLAQCVAGKQPGDRVFTREDGQPVKSFRYNWLQACVRAGLARYLCPNCAGEVPVADLRCPRCGMSWAEHKLHYRGQLFHDLRRTAVRNMVRAGIAETVAMRISGHKTRSVFDRYNITSERDLVDAAAKVQAHQESLASREQLQSGYTAPETVQAKPN